MKLAIVIRMTTFEHYRMMRWIRERGSLLFGSAVLFWLAGVIWMWRTDGLSKAHEADEETGAVEVRSPAGTTDPVALSLRREIPSSLRDADAPEGPWKISELLRAQIQKEPKADHHATAIFKDGVIYKKVLRTIANTDLIITSSDYEGSYRIGVVGSGQALESLASFPEVFRVDAR